MTDECAAENRATIRLGDSAKILAALPANSIDACVCDPPSGIGFMGRSWDSDKGGRDQWIEWLAGIMSEVLRVLKPGGHALIWALPRTSHWTGMAIENAGFEIRDRVGHLFYSGFPKSLDVSKAIDAHHGAEREVVGSYEVTRDMSGGSWADLHGKHLSAKQHDITAPATDDAKRWHGWGTAIKPATEDWWLARKPLVGTVAQNVLEWGTGGLNIDACRYAYGDDAWPGPQGEHAGYPNGPGGKSDPRHGWGAERSEDVRPNAWAMPDIGRWPANIYYCPKPSTSEREAGCDGLPVLGAGELTDREDGSDGLKSPRAGAGRTSEGRRNGHPTVKPVRLMRWLVRLVTPPGGIVLDPFMGSGTTGVAAMHEGMRFFGCEMEPDYYAIARARIEHAACDRVDDDEQAPERAAKPQGELFG